MSARIWIIAAAVLLLSGCVRPQKEAPAGELIKPTELGLSGEQAPRPQEGWWRAFGDEQLNTLIEEALAHNPSLEQALARVRSAQAQSLAAGAARQPSITLDADETRERFSENYYIPPPFGGHTYWAGEVELNLKWDLDFWGRQASLIHQAQAQTASAQLDQASARLALAGSIAQAYVDLNRAYALTDIAERAEEQRRQLLQLTRQRVAAGLDTQIELKIAEAAVPQAQSARLQAQSARDISVHRLAALAGHGADFYSRITRPRLTLDTALPLPQSLPIDLLSRRPDVLAALARVDAAGAGRAAAHAAFYPDISLSAFAGYQSIGLETLFKSSSAVFGAGPALHLPIFDAQRLRAAYKGATAALDASIAQYNDVVLNAVRETADQISLGDSLRQQIDRSHQTLDSTETAFRLSQRRYAAGLGTQLTVLNAESQVLAARRDLVSVQSGLIIARVTLLLTLGGSFNPEAPTPIAGAGVTP